MKKYFKYCVLFLIIGLANCRQDDPQPKSISDIIWDDANFSFLRAALEYTGLKDAYKTGALTVFAPTDAAFKASGYATVSSITSLPVAQVQKLLKYHIVPQKTMAANIADGTNQKLGVFSGDSIYLTKNVQGISLNGIKVTQADIEASNGVIHVVEKVLTNPQKNLLQTIQGNSEISLFMAAYQRVTANNTNPALLTAPIGYTVFVPTNKAMESIGFTADFIQKTNVVILSNVILYHFSQGRYFTPTLSTGKLQMLGGNRTIDVQNTTTGITLRGTNNTAATTAKIMTANLFATNGIVHIIDQVLVP